MPSLTARTLIERRRYDFLNGNMLADRASICTKYVRPRPKMKIRAPKRFIGLNRGCLAEKFPVRIVSPISFYP